MLHVENMTPADFSFATQLANTMNWSMTQKDFELSLKLEPQGCFVLFDKLTPIGISTCISFDKVGWFGNLVVNQAYRKKGGGKLLLQKAISHLRMEGVETIGLYAYHDLVKFYENAGFKPNGEFSVFQGISKASKTQNRAKTITEKDVPTAIEFDKECLGQNRKKLLEPILTSKNNRHYLSKSGRKIGGYLATKRTEAITEIGPLVCRSRQASLAKDLLKTALCDLDGQEVFVCLPMHNKALIEVISECGITEAFNVTRMFLGPAVAESCIYVPESLERG